MASLRAILLSIRHAPVIFRTMFELVDAEAAAARKDYVAADRHLARLRFHAARGPDWLLDRTSTALLTALVALRLGDPATAAGLAGQGVGAVRRMRIYANPSEKAYLSYVGRLIFEEATVALGDPKTLDIGLDFEDLDVRRVRQHLRDTYPVYRSRYDEAPSQLH